MIFGSIVPLGPVGRPLGLAAIALWSAGPATTQLEPNWVRARVLDERHDHAMTYDAARQRVVLLGGYTGSLNPPVETWEWDGNNWTPRSSPTSPGRLTGHAMVYDIARQRVVLFSGQTWEWDGDDWKLRSPTTSPSPRSQHAMAYDVARQRVVLYGGSANPISAETWEWDGNNWTQRSPTKSPSPRFNHAMAYDVARQRIVMFGGSGINRETWEWDGSNWTQRSPATSPAGRVQHAMAYDTARQRVVLFGGQDSSGRMSDTWEWDGSNWTQRSPATTPTGRWDHAMAYDVARQRIVLFGGVNLSDTWEWDGSNWTQRAATPLMRHGHAMAYDLTRQRCVMFGGADLGAAGLNDTWELDDRWTRLSPVTSPIPRIEHAMAYDLARRRVVLFGGTLRGATTYYGDTWEWDGNNWAQRSPATSPGPRAWHAMAYDLVRRRVVLFGGRDSNGPVSDTWEWDGSNWTQRSPSTPPSPRLDHAMCYDSARQRLVLFGGIGANGLLGDTWEWDGSNWLLSSPATSPTARRGHAMAYDTNRQRAVLFGGYESKNQYEAADTWEWDGSNWIERSNQPLRPRARESHAMAYDSARQRLVLFGGSDRPALFLFFPDTWYYGLLVQATSQSFGNPCAGRNSSLLLSGGDPELGTSRRLELIVARAFSPCVFGFSAGTQTLPIGPCTLYLKDPIVWSPFAITTWAGFAEAPLAIPFHVALRGVRLHAQAFVLDPQGPALGLSFSAARQLLLGD